MFSLSPYYSLAILCVVLLTPIFFFFFVFVLEICLFNLGMEEQIIIVIVFVLLGSCGLCMLLIYFANA